MPTDSVCPFCSVQRLGETLLEETSSFRIVADTAPLTQGHLLLIPTEHYPCLGALPTSHLPTFHESKAKIARFLQQHYGAPFYFEHGIAGQTVPHAHLHAVPGRVAILDSITKGRYTLAVNTWVQVQQFYRIVGEYLYFEQDGGSWVISRDAVPPGREGHVFVYRHTVIVLCSRCGSGHVGKHDHDCFDFEEVWD